MAISVLILGSTTKLKNARTISLTGDVTGSASFDGSKNVSINTNLANIAVLTGNISLSNGSGQANVNYPNGFNSSNCVVIALGIDIYANGKFSFYGDAGNPVIYEARLTGSNVLVKVKALDSIGTSNTKQYKLVLMKI